MVKAGAESSPGGGVCVFRQLLNYWARSAVIVSCGWKAAERRKVERRSKVEGGWVPRSLAFDGVSVRDGGGGGGGTSRPGDERQTEPSCSSTTRLFKAFNQWTAEKNTAELRWSAPELPGFAVLQERCFSKRTFLLVYRSKSKTNDFYSMNFRFCLVLFTTNEELQ